MKSKPPFKTVRRYSAETVIRAQKRVLKMVYGYMSYVNGQDTLITDGKGLTTFRVLARHLRAAYKLKVLTPLKPPKKKKQ